MGPLPGSPDKVARKAATFAGAAAVVIEMAAGVAADGV
jgi:hypothetical protein